MDWEFKITVMYDIAKVRQKLTSAEEQHIMQLKNQIVNGGVGTQYSMDVYE